METAPQASELLERLSALHYVVIAVILVFLLIGLRLIFKKPPAHLTAFSGNAGTVLVSRKALQELIRQACLLDDWVEAARPVVKLKGSQVRAHVELRLARPENLREVTQRIQERITLLLQKSLSFEQIGDIEIVVKSFAETGETSKPALPLLESEPNETPISASEEHPSQAPASHEGNEEPTSEERL